MAYIGSLVGAFISTFLLSRLFLILTRKLFANRMKATLIAYAVLVPFVIVLAALGNSDGGPMAWDSTFVYLPVLAILFLVDVIRAKERALG